MAERYGTNPAIRLEWADSEQVGLLVATVPESGDDRTGCDPTLLDTLEYAFDPKSETEFLDHLRKNADYGQNEACERMDELLDSNLLLPEDQLGERRNWVEHGWDRSLEYHLATREWSFEADGDGGVSTDCRREPNPNLVECEETVELQSPEPVPDEPLNEVLLNRRTCRDFDGSGMESTDLSSILFHSLDPVRTASDGELSRALSYFETDEFPLSVYPVVTRSDDLKRGVYRYWLEDHQLTAIEDWPEESAEEVDDRLQNFVVNQPFIQGGAATLLLTADFERFRKRHPGGAALRHLYTTISTHAHRILLTANAFGFDVFQSAALKDSDIDDFVEVDGYQEGVLYFMTIGREDE